MKLKLINEKEVSPGTKTFIFEPSEKFSWAPGQYLHYVLEHPHPDDRKTERWFTISNAPYENLPAFTTRLLDSGGSSFKEALKRMRPGDEIEADGPKGKFVIEDPSKQYIFIAGGIGITPFRSILLQLAHDKKPINVDLMYANRDDNFPFEDELAKIAADNSGLKIHKFASPKKIGDEDVKKIATSLNDPHYFVSGPEPMVEAFEERLKGMGVSEDKIHGDFFPGYEAE